LPFPSLAVIAGGSGGKNPGADALNPLAGIFDWPAVILPDVPFRRCGRLPAGNPPVS
jgi:hypothetical protein